MLIKSSGHILIRQKDFKLLVINQDDYTIIDTIDIGQ
jgi:hypothetical protein